MSTAGNIPSDGNKGLVTYAVKVGAVGGKLDPLPDSVNVLAIVVDREVNRVPSAHLVVGDGDAASASFSTSTEDYLIPGKAIEIELGWSSANTTVFKGVIVKQGIKSMPGSISSLLVDCRDLAVQMTVGRKSMYHEQETDQEVLQDLIKTYSNLTAEVETTSPTFANQGVVQYNATDWDFMLSRAEANGMLVAVDDGTINIAKPTGSPDTVLDLKYGTNILEVEAEMDARTQFDAIAAVAWDPATQELLSKTPADPGLKDLGNLSASDLAAVVGLENLELRHTGKLADTELQAWADARAVKSALARICGRVRFEGFPAIKPGVYIKLDGLGDRYNGEAYVTGVRQTMQNGMWTTDAQFGLSERWFSYKPDIVDTPAAGLLPAVTGLQIATVTELEADPDGEDRIRVVLPLINKDEEGIWARVASLDAGKYRGSFFRPEVGDEVVVGFLNDDPRDPIILGQLNSSDKPAPVEAATDNHEKGIYTRSGMRISFNDDERSITVMTMADGEDLEGLRKSGPKAEKNNTITLSDSDGSILVQDKNENSILLNSDGITLTSKKTIKLDADTIELNAKSKLLATSKSSSEFSSSGTTVVKGTTVNIN